MVFKACRRRLGSSLSWVDNTHSQDSNAAMEQSTKAYTNVSMHHRAQKLELRKSNSCKHWSRTTIWLVLRSANGPKKRWQWSQEIFVQWRSALSGEYWCGRTLTPTRRRYLSYSQRDNQFIERNFYWTHHYGLLNCTIEHCYAFLFGDFVTSLVRLGEQIKKKV